MLPDVGIDGEVCIHPSFRKLMMEIPIKLTLWTALSNFVRIRWKFFGQFRRLVQTKIQPSSFIIRCACVLQINHCIICHLN